MPGPSTQGKPWEERLNEAGAKFEEELKRVVRYIDDQVVPEVRRNGSAALRVAAEQLQKLAEHMDDSNRKRPGGGPQ